MKDFVLTCEAFQWNKTDIGRCLSFLQPLPISNHEWEASSIDFITSLPWVGEKNSIYVVVDRLTKYAYFITMDFSVH